MKNKHNYILLILTSITLYILFKNQDIHQIFDVFLQSNLKFILVALLCMFLFWLIEAILFYLLLKQVTPYGNFWTCIKTTIIGQYYSFITPFASGGQPMQLYILNKEKVPYSKGTAIILGKFLLFQITVTLYGLIVFIYRYYHDINGTALYYNFVILALGINIFGLITIITFSLKPDLIKKVVNIIIKALKKIGVVKEEEKLVDKCTKFVEDYKGGIKQLKENMTLTLIMFLVSIIQITILFSITYFVYKSLGLNDVGFLDVISLQGLLYMSISFIPTPGTVGASEVGFYMILGSIFPHKMMVAAVLLWRVISYYFGLFFCGIFTFLNTVLEKNYDT